MKLPKRLFKPAYKTGDGEYDDDLRGEEAERAARDSLEWEGGGGNGTYFCCSMAEFGGLEGMNGPTMETVLRVWMEQWYRENMVLGICTIMDGPEIRYARQRTVLEHYGWEEVAKVNSLRHPGTKLRTYLLKRNVRR